MPVVKIGMWAGREKGTKKKLIENVTKTVCETLGCPAQAVIVILEDIPKENWGQDGKQGG
ncbi:MAG: tautomerase family protein [Candidatus Margulisbacteria bacterium]|jgi:4-oxalocrotonate tautomerase|nr:tautomerase family protein [Candidatus Margulisiibacteriota bacterium]